MPWFRWPSADARSARDAATSTAVTAVVPRPPDVPHTRFTPDHLAVLTDLYLDADCPLDSLPYTGVFDELYGHFVLKTGLNASQHSVWRALVGRRKAGKLRRPDAADGAAGE